MASAAGAKTYDLAVVGAGPGGYVASIRAAQLGLETICVDKRPKLGGTCLNIGCIPSKVMLNTTQKLHDAQHSFPQTGLSFKEVKVDFAAMQRNKDNIVARLTDGIATLFRANKVDFLHGDARFLDNETLEVQLNQGNGRSADSSRVVQARNIVIATGSETSQLPASQGEDPLVVDERIILSSTGALALEKVPRSLAIIGGGIIGIELGSVYSRLGSSVTIVEYLDTLLPSMDQEVVRAFQRILRAQGLQFLMGTRVTGARVLSAASQSSVELHLEDVVSKVRKTLTSEKVMVSVGRKPHTSGLGLELINTETAKDGSIPVDDHYRIPGYSNVFAIGDVVRGPMLAHKAEEEGIAVAEIIAGKPGFVNYNAIPSVIYTHPELAGLGKTEERLKSEGVAYKTGKSAFAANSRARAVNETDGMVKVVADERTNEILGAWIMGSSAGELIQSFSLAIAHKISCEDIARTAHAHPTLSEAVKEACMAAAFGHSLHSF